ncbi:MAG: class I tRNA ligase family protein [Dehalococcoidia bacterium]|nr:class I tRNA ligase family protein [Dehalococcoidia bacterium]
MGNPWLDAGIVAFSTMHYREKPEEWARWFPADFITESFPGQFRNWFYSLLAQSVRWCADRPSRTSWLRHPAGRRRCAMHKSWAMRSSSTRRPT